MIPVGFDQQVIPGSFEHALCYLVDHEIDFAGLEARHRNDTSGAPAFAPAVLLKIVLLAYSRGLISSRAIATACRHNVLFMAVSGDSCPHFTTIAAFISELGEEVAAIFARVLVICDRQGLIGRELFAIDGVKLPANASKARSGTRADFQREADKMEAAIKKIMAGHAVADAADSAPEAVRAARTLERVKKEAAQIRAWLDGNPEERRSAKGKVRLSNRTDNESAKMATGKGVIQGYTGVAAVDAKAQIVIDAQAHGTGSEQELLLPVIESTAPNRTPATAICADAGYHSETNLKALADHGIDAWICDNDYRSRDVRYAGQAKHKAKPDPLWDKAKSGKKTRCFTPADFSLAADRTHCVCPAGERLYSNGSNCTFNGYAAMKYRGAERNCVPCELRTQCLRKPDTTKTRQVAFFQGRRSIEESHTERMKRRIDSDIGKRMITARFATVEPVFGNLRANKRLQRFTLRGQKKVDGQWKLYCLVHNIEKLAHHGYAQ
jgi:transposase